MKKRDYYLKLAKLLKLGKNIEPQEILKQQVPLIPGLSGAAKKLNETNHLNAPTIAHFHFWEKGEIEDPPYGTMIIREEYEEV